MNMEGGMGHDAAGMMMDMGPVVFGNIHLVNLLLMVSGVFYLLCALSIFKTWRQEKNELVGALFAFLCYQAISMFFMGVEMQTMNMLYSNIAALAVFVGSAYMLKFPFSKFAQKTRNALFLISLVILLAVFVWFIQTGQEKELMMFTLWYDLIVNGIVVGGSIIMFGLRSTEGLFKKKAIGGGTGVVSCCVVATGSMIGGAMLFGTVFSFLAPIIILSTLRQKSAAASLAASATSTTSNL